MLPDVRSHGTSARRTGRAILVALLCTGVLLQGCTTVRHVPVPATVPAGFRPDVRQGDRVEITLKDGQMRQFRVTAVTADALQGKSDGVAYQDIAVLHVRKVSAGRTVAMTLGVAAATVAVLYGVALYQLTRGDE